jgi:hypothetical protein
VVIVLTSSCGDLPAGRAREGGHRRAAGGAAAVEPASP